MINFDRVSLEYLPGRYALRDVSFTLNAGSFTFLTGHSGAGKSSLLRLVACLERPSHGEIQVGNILYKQLKPRQEPALRQQMGIVFQDNQLLLDRSVFDNVAFPLIIGGYRYADIKTRVSAALKRVGLGDKALENPQVLSGGEQQRIGIARAVVARSLSSAQRHATDAIKLRRRAGATGGPNLFHIGRPLAAGHRVHERAVRFGAS